MELAPYSGYISNQRAGCQGFIGPFPSAFLDKRCVKNWCKDNEGFYNSKFSFNSIYIREEK
jgi:hypothetical protein